MRKITTLLLAFVQLALFAGCFQEEVREIDITGTLRIPVEMVSQSSSELGVVYIGLYADADADTLGFTYPFMGPVVGSASWGNSYPYGGTTIGVFSFPCVREGKCRMVTGRYGDLDQVIDALGIGQGTEPPWTDEDYWDACQDYFGYTDPMELNFVGEDRLNFHEEDGYYVADWKIWHVDPQDDAENRPVLWAFADNGLQSCNPDGGSSNRDDGPWFREGDMFPDVINMPGKYLTDGDLFTSEPTELAVGQTTDYVINLDTVFDQ